jgi:hypothetical protein
MLSLGFGIRMYSGCFLLRVPTTISSGPSTVHKCNSVHRSAHKLMVTITFFATPLNGSRLAHVALSSKRPYGCGLGGSHPRLACMSQVASPLIHGDKREQVIAALAYFAPTGSMYVPHLFCIGGKEPRSACKLFWTIEVDLGLFSCGGPFREK